MKRVLTAMALLISGVVAALVPLRPYMDFQVLFHANMGLRLGIPLYDQPGQVEMIARFAGVPAGQVYVLPFPYPPWYALSTVWLATLPVDMAARVWFWLNLLMLAASVVMLTHRQSHVRRALVFLGAIFWLPTLGSLFVGQYGFPVLLGAALMVHGFRRERSLWIAAAAALLTFKPHLGLLIILLAMVQLLRRRDRFSRNTWLCLLAAAAILFGLGFLASPAWPIEYARSLTAFGGIHGVPECTQCVSLPVLLARLLGGGLVIAAWLALTLAALTGGWLAWRWKSLLAENAAIVPIGALVTLLVSPYLLNYDYLLLLVPLIMLAGGEHSPSEWIALGLAYILPAAALALLGPSGSAAPILSTLIVLVITIRQLRTVAGTPARSAA